MTTVVNTGTSKCSIKMHNFPLGIEAVMSGARAPDCTDAVCRLRMKAFLFCYSVSILEAVVSGFVLTKECFIHSCICASHTENGIKTNCTDGLRCHNCLYWKLC